MQEKDKVAEQLGEILYFYPEVFLSFCQIFKHQEIKNYIVSRIEQLLSKVNCILHIVEVFAITHVGEK